MLVALASVAVAATSNGSAAESVRYPTRSVRLVVPFPAGGATDLAARLVGGALAKVWGQPVIVENRTGGASTIGTAAVAQAPADGHTLLFGPSGPFVEASVMMKELPYDPVKSFAAIMELYKISLGLSVNSKVPAHTLDELIKLAGSRSLTFGTFGVGNSPHILLETFKKEG